MNVKDHAQGVVRLDELRRLIDEGRIPPRKSATTQFVNTQMPLKMVRAIDMRRAEITMTTGKNISRGEIVRECIRKALLLED